MGKDEGGQLSSAKRAYRSANSEGNREEEARWANVIGDILKNRGEYVESLKWFRKDYDISIKHLPEKQLLPTCQSLGEVYLRLEFFKDALIYQKKHLDLARDSDDLVEQQRACTQLGRTHHEMFLRSNDDHYSVRKAKKYFNDAMQISKTLKENPQSCKISFLKEFIDAHNNIGMLEMDLDNLEEAEKTLTKGLDICDEEEVSENNDARSRLHHNLGNVYMELRDWDNARDNIEKDIVICKQIGQCQGEAKGYINLGELHYRVQKYEDAFLCYKKALDLARSMEDENSLVEQIEQNIKTVKEAEKVIDEMKKEEQKFKKLLRNLVTARGTSAERKCLLQQNASADSIIEKSSIICAWKKHLEFAKRKKKISRDLCDKEKLSDSFLAIGESYQKLRKFKKALKWYERGWDSYKLIRNLEGQALVKINIGDVLDSDGDWCGALDAFEEGYRIAVEANLQSVQISALENMHYSHMIRFDNVDEARRLQSIIDNLNNLKTMELDSKHETRDCCPETDSDGSDCLLSYMPNSSPPEVDSKHNFSYSNHPGDVEEDNVPLTSPLPSGKPNSKCKSFNPEKCSTSYEPSMDPSPKILFQSNRNHERVTGRKRIRFVLSDDEDDDTHNEKNGSIRVDKNNGFNFDDDATSSECKSVCHPVGLPDHPCKNQDSVMFPSKDDASSSVPAFEDITSSHKTYSCSNASQGCKCSKCMTSIVLSPNISHGGSNCGQDQTQKLFPVEWNIFKPDIDSDQCVTFNIDNDSIQIDMSSHDVGGELNIESLKVEIACLYFLQLHAQKRTKGLVPVVENIKYDGKTLYSEDFDEALVTKLRKCLVEVLIGGWEMRSLMRVYIECCEELSETPNLKLIKQLYKLEVSEDEVIVSNCGLQDISVTPLLRAVHLHKTIALLNLSHNLLGNGTVEKLKQVFSTSSQSYGGLTLDLHCNRLGPTALFQICECSVLFTRLEVLNVSGNRLTDACGSYLSTILKNCKALYSLNVERCSITSITIQKLAASIDPESMLSQLYIGHNGPIIGNAITTLLLKLANLIGFSEISLNGLKLGKPVIESLCQFAKSSCLSGLSLGGSNIGTDNGIQLMESLFSRMQDFLKLDLSFCGLTSRYTDKLNSDFSSTSSILELNLEGNPISQQGGAAIASILSNPQCYIRVLALTNCGLSLPSLLQIMQALADNSALEVLRLAKNATYDNTKNRSSEFLDLTSSVVDDPRSCPIQLNIRSKNTSCNQLEVADSEDEIQKDELPDEIEKADMSEFGTCGGLWKKEFASAILAAKSLKKLDLSKNGLSVDYAMSLYRAWSSHSRAKTAQKHVKGEVVHFYLQGSSCCGALKCCGGD